MFTPATAASTRSSAPSASRREVRLCAAIAASTSAAAINVSLIASRPAVLPRTAINVAAIRSGNACQSRYAGVRRPDWVSLLLNVSFSSKSCVESTSATGSPASLRASALNERYTLVSASRSSRQRRGGHTAIRAACVRPATTARRADITAARADCGCWMTSRTPAAPQ